MHHEVYILHNSYCQSQISEFQRRTFRCVFVCDIDSLKKRVAYLKGIASHFSDLLLAERFEKVQTLAIYLFALGRRDPEN